MRKRIALWSCVLLAASSAVLAVDQAQKESIAKQKEKAHQQLVKSCNAKAGDKKGEERREFMSICLKGG